MMNLPQSQLTVFFSYSHKDEDLLNQLIPHLANLRRQKYIKTWYDRDISGGNEWTKEIDKNLAAADIILLLISANFINSEYCYTTELTQAIERHESGTARVIPIILKPCDWKDSLFSELQAFPKNAKPITTYSNLDEAFTEVVQGIRKVVDEMLIQKQASAKPPTLNERAISTTNKQPSIMLCLHGWTYEDYGNSCDAELNWTSHFNNESQFRRLPTPETWEKVLLPQLRQVKETLTQNHTGLTIDLRGRLPLTVALAVGILFPGLAYTIQTEQRNQRTKQNELWRSDARGSEDDSGVQFEVAHEQGQPGANILFAIDVGRPIWDDVLRLYQSPNYSFNAVVHLKSKIDSLQSDADATALADGAAQKINYYRNCYGADCVHLLLACPQGLAVFLGQQLRLFYKLATYEHQPTDEERYVPSVIF